ncbi:GldG family protein [Metallibacterium sp.]
MRARLDALLVYALLLIAAAALGYLSTRYSATWDWTYEARASVAPQSIAVLRDLRQPLQVTSYTSPGSGLRATISGFIARYQRYKPNLSLRFIDPATDPAAVRAAGISVDGELVLRYGDRSLHLTQLSDQSFTDALANLARGGTRLVAFVSGDGERSAEGRANADLGSFMAQMAAQGVRALPLNLAQVASVPQNANLVVLASPLAQLSPDAVHALVQWLHDGGNLLWLTDPGSVHLGLAPLARELGIRALPGEIIDPSGAAAGVRDPRVLVVSHYPPDPITRGFALDAAFPGVVALARTQGNWKYTPLLRSSPQSYTAAAGVGAPPAYSASAGDLRGPLDFGFALTRLSANPLHTEQRVVVIGDGDFISNTFLGNGGNAALGTRIFDWLLGDDTLVHLPPRAAPDRHLDIGQRGLNALTLTLAALPLLLLALASVLWLRRRRH